MRHHIANYRCHMCWSVFGLGGGWNVVSIRLGGAVRRVFRGLGEHGLHGSGVTLLSLGAAIGVVGADAAAQSMCCARGVVCDCSPCCASLLHSCCASAPRSFWGDSLPLPIPAPRLAREAWAKFSQNALGRRAGFSGVTYWK